MKLLLVKPVIVELGVGDTVQESLRVEDGSEVRYIIRLSIFGSLLVLLKIITHVELLGGVDRLVTHRKHTTPEV